MRGLIALPLWPLGAPRSRRPPPPDGLGTPEPRAGTEDSETIGELARRVERAIDHLLALFAEGEDPGQVGVSVDELEAARRAIDHGEPVEPELAAKIVPLVSKE